MKTQEKKTKVYNEGEPTEKKQVRSISDNKDKEKDPGQYQEKIDDGLRFGRNKK